MTFLRGTLVASAAVLLFAAPASAGPPLTGVYNSDIVLGGELIEGRHTESWAAPGNFLTVGNVLNAASYNGVTLGTQWSYSCPNLSSTFLVANLVNPISGNGQKIWLKTFSTGAGSFFLNGTGEAWDGGDPTYSGTFLTFSESVIIIFQNFHRVAANASITWTGSFTGSKYPCIQWQANGAEEGNFDLDGALPANYPAYLDPTCDPTRTMGIWWLHTDITMTIFNCTVPTKEKTWGAIKSMYDSN